MVEIIDNSTCHINDIVQKSNIVVNDYKLLFSLPCEKFIKIIVTDNIYRERLELSETEREKQDIILLKDNFFRLNGLLVPPRKETNLYHVIIHQYRYENNLYEKTLPHELTHAIDFFFYKEIYPETELRVHDDVLYYCSEIHAVYIGYKFYLKDISKDFDIKSYTIQTLETTLDEIRKAYNANNKKQIKKTYAVFLGEYMAFKKKVDSKELYQFKLFIPYELETILDKNIDKLDFIKGYENIHFLHKMTESFIKDNNIK